jgi:hypothetical protein
MRGDGLEDVFEKYCYDADNWLTALATGGSGLFACSSSGSGIVSRTVTLNAITHLLA